jgi:putative tryptophan/tyrosine transport system substrate-binding protein
MKRREFIKLVGGMAVAPWVLWLLTARAQQTERVRRIGVLMPYPENDRALMGRVAALQAGLRDLGWREGRNIRIDYRYAPTAELIRVHAAELVSLTPDVLIANTNLVAVTLQHETHAIPIIFIAVADPIGEGLVASVARPGGNVTGFTSFETPMSGKWVGSDITEAYRLTGIYTGRILRGDKPAELPVQQATKVELSINLKTAKALGLNVPNTLVGRADEVFE